LTLHLLGTLAKMTPRQRNMVQLFAEGRPSKEIAGVLDKSEKTVEFHKHHIREAFNDVTLVKTAEWDFR
jgi:DNA-binding CsgD family transcriptional regulator